jgi:hypothetical protein
MEAGLTQRPISRWPGFCSSVATTPRPCTSEAIVLLNPRCLVAVEFVQGVSKMVFGDLFLADVRAYREAKMASSGIEPLFPLRGRDTAKLAREMLAGGLQATLTCVDPGRLDRSFAGRTFDAALLASLPAGVDPCGENGEFHTFVSAGPMFRAPLKVVVGEVVEREGFVFADVLPRERRLNRTGPKDEAVLVGHAGYALGVTGAAPSEPRGARLSAKPRR